MADILIPSKGCVYATKRSSGAQRFYSLEPNLEGSAESPIIIEGVDSTLQDIVFPVATLDEKKYFYVMGDDFGNVSVNGVVLLGTSESKGAAFGAVRDYFEANRSIVSMKPISVSCPGNVKLKFYLTALTISKADPQFNLQFFQLRGVLAEPKKA
jgi:hypothetical protein